MHAKMHLHTSFRERTCECDHCTTYCRKVRLIKIARYTLTVVSGPFIRIFKRGEKIERKKCDIAAETQRLLGLGYQFEPKFQKMLYIKQGLRTFKWANDYCSGQGTSLPIPRSGKPIRNYRHMTSHD